MIQREIKSDAQIRPLRLKFYSDPRLKNRLISSALCQSVEKILVCQQSPPCSYSADETDESLIQKPITLLVQSVDRLPLHVGQNVAVSVHRDFD